MVSNPNVIVSGSPTCWNPVSESRVYPLGIVTLLNILSSNDVPTFHVSIHGSFPPPPVLIQSPSDSQLAFTALGIVSTPPDVIKLWLSNIFIPF